MPPSPDSAALTAELARFDQDLRGSGSATALLARWMTARGGRASISILAKPVHAPASPPAPEQMERLDVKAPGQIAYRRVRLTDGRHVLSDAHNWYVPSRLTEDMRTLLTETVTPFGMAVAPLSPTRETLCVEKYWPSPDARPPLQRLPTLLLRHDALVRGRDGKPLCEVSEYYTRNILL